MAVVQDPTGRSFRDLEPKRHKGTEIAEMNDALLGGPSTPDPASATLFYSGLFGWKLEPGHDGSGYLHIRNGEQFIGGIPPVSHRDPKIPAHWLPYFTTSDCDESAGKAAQRRLRPARADDDGRCGLYGRSERPARSRFCHLPGSSPNLST